jgi:hypothetical protein
MRTITEKNLLEFIGKDAEVVPKCYLQCGVAMVKKAGMMYRFKTTRIKGKIMWMLYEKHPLMDYRQIQLDRIDPEKKHPKLDKNARLKKYLAKQKKNH